MTKGLWKIVGLCGIGATVLIAAFAFDSKEEVAAEQGDANLTLQECKDLCGGQSMSYADSDTHACISTCLVNLDDEDITRLRNNEVANVVSPVDHEARAALQEETAQRWTCPMEAVPAEHNAVPRAFMDKPVLAGLLAKVHADLTHPDAIRAAVVRAARSVKERRMVEFLTECGLPTDSHYGIDGIRLFLPCLTDAAQALADFRTAAEREEDVAQEMSRMKYNLVPRALADFPVPPEIEAQANVCSGIGGVLRCRVLPLLVIVSPTMYWHWSDLQTTYVLQPVDATAADTPYGSHWYGPDGTPMSDPPQRGIVRDGD